MRIAFMGAHGVGKTTLINELDITDSRFYISGQVSKMVQFYGEWNAAGAYDSNTLKKAGVEETGYAKNNSVGFAEGGVNFVFMPELQVRAGKVRVPFTRYQLTGQAKACLTLKILKRGNFGCLLFLKIRGGEG